ncbi:MAG: dynamin family protein [Planctomycetota bacterium]|nr:dynamin family protein [Planctomycetota bacterium]
MPDPARFPHAKSLAASLLAAAKQLDLTISEQCKAHAFPGSAEYHAAGVKDALRKAELLLAKDHYKLCFAGGFSAGKSTVINALVGVPDLLPTAAGECTLSITILTGPFGGRELVRVKYFPRDVAIRQVVFHQKRYRNAFKQFDAKARGASSEQLLGIIRETIAWMSKAHQDESLPEALRKEFDKGKAAKYASELEEFLHYIDKYAGRCGTIIEDELKNAHIYLTYDQHQGGLGHLFMIDQVFIHKRHELFEEKNIQIVDLPGIDSTNAYARQVTLDYLTEADLVVNVLPPQGFTMSYIDIINEMSEANRGNIANKMFYIINRFDANEEKNFTKQELESLLRDQIAAEIDKNGLNSRNLYATVALFDIHRLRGNQQAYDALMASCASKLRMMGNHVDQPWRKIAEDALTGRGISVVREAILKYLQEQLAFERLRDIRINCQVALDAAHMLLARNDQLLQQAKSRKTSAIGEMRDFIIKTQQAFEVNLVGLANALPAMIGQAVQSQLKPAVANLIGNIKKIPMADPAKQIAFTGSAAKLQTPAGIKQHWIDYCKQFISDKFVELTSQTIVGNVQALIDQQVKQSKVDVILDQIGACSSKDLTGPLRTAIATARQNVAVLTRLRADEETWTLRSTPIHPQGFEPAWTPAIEEAFKNDLIATFTKHFQASCDRLAATLGNYYKAVITALIADFKSHADDLESAIKNTPDLDLPVHLLEGGQPDPEEAKRKQLLIIDQQWAAAKAKSDELAPLLAG